MRNQAMEGRPSLRRRIPVALAALALGLGVAACGDDEDEATDEAATEETSASTEEVTLTAIEYEFDLSATPTADTKTVTFDNQGEEQHVMIFAKINEGFTVDEAFELEGKKGSAEVVGETAAKPGESVDVELEKPLEPGSYAMLCPIGGPDGPHYLLGQLQEFEIE